MIFCNAIARSLPDLSRAAPAAAPAAAAPGRPGPPQPADQVARRPAHHRPEPPDRVVVQGVVAAAHVHQQDDEGRLGALSPTAILARGYALVFDEKGRLVRDSAQLHPGSHVKARLARGHFEAEVTSTDDETE